MTRTYAYAIVILTVLSCFASTNSNGQISGFLGRKNIVKIQFNVSPGTSSRRPVKLLSDEKNKMFFTPFGYSVDLGYERIITRKVGICIDYSFGSGRMSMAAGEAKKVYNPVTGYNETPEDTYLEDPKYRNHGFMISANLYTKDIAPLRTYFKIGLGASVNAVNEIIKTGKLYKNASVGNNYHIRRENDYTQTGELLIKGHRIFLNPQIGIGVNWAIAKRTLINFEFGTKINIGIDGKSESISEDLFGTHPGLGGDFNNFKNERDLNRNLSQTKIRQEVLYFSFGFKFAI
jgi:hypothetical protein